MTSSKKNKVIPPKSSIKALCIYLLYSKKDGHLRMINKLESSFALLGTVVFLTKHQVPICWNKGQFVALCIFYPSQYGPLRKTIVPHPWIRASFFMQVLRTDGSSYRISSSVFLLHSQSYIDVVHHLIKHVHQYPYCIEYLVTRTIMLILYRSNLCTSFFSFFK